MRVGRGAVMVIVVLVVVAYATTRGEGSSSDRGVVQQDGVVSEVIDGDTLVLRSGQHVRLIGIDTPERGQCGYERATQALRRLVQGRAVDLVNPDSVIDQDRYDRLLRYVDVDGRDSGYLQITRGLAKARYDSVDGYDHHPREERYRSAGRATTYAC